MKLKSLRLQGFKSFADRTTLDFRPGVTAIVGSNGCGKSNIADSIRWVLGEQRASAMRGAKMEEIIFQGTTRRRPLHHAEVALLFENDRGRVALPQSEIEVARKVFREGGSEYALNRQACRLRDIHNLLRDTGLGSNAYAVIEATMIETLLSDRAEERRMLFEEAAGIGRYKDSRQAAMRRLEAAEADLARLQDLLAEVESKVRSLARQRRRAERHEELRLRRLDLEVAISLAELEGLRDELEVTEARRVELEREELTAAAERRAAEQAGEEARGEGSELARERSAVGRRLDDLRARLDTRERERLVANERRAHAEMRIQELVRERGELEVREATLAREAETTAAEVARRSEALAGLREKLEERGTENQTVRSAVAAERAAADGAAARARELAREIAATEGERSATLRRRREAEELAAEVEAREKALRSQLTGLEEQGELFGARAGEARALLAAATSAAESARAEIGAIGEQEREVRESYHEVQDRLSHLSSQVDAREALERGYEGFAPAVGALMARFDRSAGVRGPLVDFLDGRGGRAELERVEAYLGSLLQAVVVDDRAVAARVRTWFFEEWTGGGSLLLLPLDAPVLAGIDRAAGGERWAQALLEGVALAGADPLAGGGAGAGVGPSGEVVDDRGIVRLVARSGGEGILARRETLERLRREREMVEGERSAIAAAREELRRALASAEDRAARAEEERRRLEDELKQVDLDSASHSHHLTRLREDRERAAESLAALRANAVTAGERLAALDARLQELVRDSGQATAAEALARERLEDLEARWEEARDQEAELRVAVARGEAELRDAERRRTVAEQGRAAAVARRGAVEREAVELRRGIEDLSGVGGEAVAEIERLFLERDREAETLSRLDARIGELDAAEQRAGEATRAAARREAAASEERHRRELRIAELRSKAERSVERLEVEWGRPWDVLVDSAREVEEGGVEEWTVELQDLSRQIEAIGPVNALAVREHAEEEARLQFLSGQRDDLVSARDDLVSAIRQINRTAREVFMDTFTAVRENFQRVFQSLFQGGECDVWLADPEDPLESSVEIQASPRGKRTQRIHLLSGGERTLTALALLFALYLVKPSPFCLLDEVDAPLDDSNVARFLQLLHDFKADTQFIVITHNPHTMEAADWVYGVTMEEPGVSSIVGVELLGRWASGDPPLADA
jgi:chromosome segregation protein